VPAFYLQLIYQNIKIKIILYLCLVNFVGACAPDPTPLGEIISRRKVQSVYFIEIVAVTKRERMIEMLWDKLKMLGLCGASMF